MRSLLAALVMLVASNGIGSASACSLPTYADDGRYVGGDLVAQIARKADTIQIVRATARHIVRRTYSEGDWYYRFGGTNVPDTWPEYIDEFVYELTVLETLKGGAQAAFDHYESDPRILAYGARELRGASRQESLATERTSPNALPEGLLERPGHDGMAFTGGAQEGAGLGLGPCNGPYAIDVDQTFIALRDSMGRLYSGYGRWGPTLPIDVEFRSQSGKRERFAFNVQSLVPVEGDSDSFLTRLRDALAGQTR